MQIALAAVAALLLTVSADIYFQEKFHPGWEKNWVASKNKGPSAGEFKWSAGKYFNDAEEDKGIQTSQDARFYGLSAEFKPFSNKGKSLIIQFTVKHEQNIDCGGGYVKIFPSGLDQADMHGDSVYNIMFGPDICGPGTRRVHVIFNYKGTNHLIKKTIPCKFDEATHLYTLIVNPDQTYEVRIDDAKVESGSLTEDWDFLPAKEINDPAQSKPKDWVDAKTIADETDEKPAEWDKPEFISDPKATKPEDWDDEMDGDWEAPQISNPEYKGEWKAKQIPNPAYKGEWVHPQIANPAYHADDSIYAFEDNAAIGFDLWQVKAGTVFDNVLITDDLAVQAAWAKDFKTQSQGEEKAKKAAEEAEAAAKAAEKPAAAQDDEEDDEDEEDEQAKKDEL
jgi:calreticulin